MTEPLRVVVAGGGTAGHVEPALNLADELTSRGAVVTALGTAKGLETRLVPERGYELDLIPPVPLPRKLNRELLTVPSRLRAAIRGAQRALVERKADVLVGFGGYVATPAYVAARRAGIPIVVHEANAKAGLANRIGARFTRFVAETRPGTLPHGEVVGLPLRRSISELDRAARRNEARQHFGLDPDRPVLLVFGGSQGARRINDTVVAAAEEIVGAGGSVLHVVGGKNLDQVPEPPLPDFHTVDYVDRMDLAYAAADLAVCRSGAMTVAEVSSVGLPAVFVPLPIGNGEQRRNAEGLIAAGGGLLIDDADFDAQAVQELVKPLLFDDQRLLAMSTAAGAFGVRGAGARLADMTFEAAGGRHE